MATQPAANEACREHLLVFGGSGAIGSAVVQEALRNGWKVTAVARGLSKHHLARLSSLAIDPLSERFSGAELNSETLYTSVCWAQGSNLNDSVYDVNMTNHRRTYEVNCMYILVTLQALLERSLLARGSRLCILSSIWQNLARQSKLSYCMSKAALQGLVLSASADLAADAHLINAVLPGVVDTPMTRNCLDPSQIDAFGHATAHRRLVTLNDVVSLVCFLCSPANTGITGQFIAVDLGFSHVRLI